MYCLSLFIQYSPLLLSDNHSPFVFVSLSLFYVHIFLFPFPLTAYVSLSISSILVSSTPSFPFSLFPHPSSIYTFLMHLPSSVLDSYLLCQLSPASTAPYPPKETSLLLPLSNRCSRARSSPCRLRICCCCCWELR